MFTIVQRSVDYTKQIHITKAVKNTVHMLLRLSQDIERQRECGYRIFLCRLLGRVRLRPPPTPSAVALQTAGRSQGWRFLIDLSLTFYAAVFIPEEVKNKIIACAVHTYCVANSQQGHFRE